MNLPAAYYIKIAPTDHADYSGDMSQRINRGVIEAVGTGILQEVEDQERWNFLKPGTVIYYKGGYKIADSIYVKVEYGRLDDEIISYEEGE